MKGKTPFGSLVLALGLLLTCACSSGAQLVVISPHTNDIKATIKPLFEEWYRKKTGKSISVKWINMGGSNDALKYVRSEFAKRPGGIDIDLFWGGGISPYFTLKKEGLLQRTELAPETLAAIPPVLGGVPLFDVDRQWYGSCLSCFGIMANRSVCAARGLPVVKTWQELTSPQYADLLGSADPRHSGSNHVAFDMILQKLGWEKGWEVLTLLAANMKRFNISSKDVVKDLTSGDTAFCLSVDYYAWKEIEQQGADKVAFIVPEDISMVNPDCFGVLKGAPHSAEAKLFIEFVLSPECQRVWMARAGSPGGPPSSSLYRLSIVKSVYDDIRKDTLIDFNPFTSPSGAAGYSVEKSEQLWDITGDLFGSLLVDRHDELKQAWARIAAGGNPPDAIAELCRMPVTEAEALQLAAQWKDPKRRNDTISQWQEFARAKYAAAAAKVK
ncbi:MAG: extracellular solute-binding protein [Acidobacteria bacterium]|nr:extracellular solute-binding protein [Acidobacteriota bacterium]